MEPKLMSDAKEDSGLWPGNARACGRAWQKKEKPLHPPRQSRKAATCSSAGAKFSMG